MKIYQHYKGGIYALVGITNKQNFVPKWFKMSLLALHTENNENVVVYSDGKNFISKDEKLVVYQNLNGELFARPHDMFFEEVEIEDIVFPLPRFKEIGEFTYGGMFK